MQNDSNKGKAELEHTASKSTSAATKMSKNQKVFVKK